MRTTGSSRERARGSWGFSKVSPYSPAQSARIGSRLSAALASTVPVMRSSGAKLLLLSGATLVAPLAAQGCCMFEDRIAEHEQVCRKNLKVIVHDHKLWREYQRLAEISYLKRDDDYRSWIASGKGPKKVPGGPDISLHAKRSFLESVDGFEERYGDSIKNIRPVSSPRPYSEGKLVRDDLFLMKDQTVVLQFIDYITSFTSLGGGSTGLSCLGDYGIIYLSEGDV